MFRQSIWRQLSEVYRKLTGNSAKYSVVALLCLAVSGASVYHISNEYVLSQSEERIRDAMLEIRAFHHYIQNDMLPHYYRLMEEGRLPQGFYAPELLSSSYIARNFQKYYNKERAELGLPQIVYKIAAKDPRNAVNQATPEEERLLEMFNKDRTLNHYRFTSKEAGQDYLVIAVPFLVNQERCLVCHGGRDDSPSQLQDIYRWTGGFGRKVGDIPAIEIMKTPVQASINAPTLATILTLFVLLVILVSSMLNIFYRRVIREKVRDLETRQQQLALERDRSNAASKAKSVFLANMSHEIRTPLNGIMGMLQLLQISDLGTEQKLYADHAIKASNRLTRLLSDILDLSRVEAGKLSIANEPFNLTELFQATDQLFRPAFEQADITLTFRFSPDIPRSVVGDGARLQQVLSNLIGNALKFTESGGVSVEAVALTPVKPGTCRVLFSVIDTGRGIPDDQLDRLFEPFVQEDEGYARRNQGAGLGLTISRQLLELMDSHLVVASELGVGTEVHFSCVFALAEDRFDAGVPALDALRQPVSLSILLAEDEPIGQLSLSTMLERLGHQVVAVGSGREALEALRNGDFDCILMDIQMPEMDGVQATGIIRNSPELGAKAQIPIIAITAYAMQSDREKLLAAGMNGYVSKPVQLSELAKAVARISGARKQTAGDAPAG